MDQNWPSLIAVVDTNVVACHVLQEQPFAAQALAFLNRARGLLAPNTWRSELANALWMAVRTHAIPAEEAAFRLRDAEDLDIESVNVAELCAGALARSLESGVPVYDTLFVELAHQRQIPLATFDQQVLEDFPEVARHPRELLEEG